MVVKTAHAPLLTAAEMHWMHRRMMRQGSENHITGDELRRLILSKWGRSYDVRLQRRGSKVYLHVMWKHLEQRSFHLTAAQYQQQLDAVAEYLQVRAWPRMSLTKAFSHWIDQTACTGQVWGVSDVVRNGIASASARGPGFTGGGSARAVSIPLVESSATGKEWES